MDARLSSEQSSAEVRSAPTGVSHTGKRSLFALPRSKYDLSTTVILECDPSGVPYYNSDIIRAVQDCVEPASVIAVGTIGTNSVKFLTFSSRAAATRFLSRRVVHVKGKPAELVCAQSSEILVRVSWLPPLVPDNIVSAFFGKYGQVHKVFTPHLTEPGFEHVQISERYITMDLNDAFALEDLPYMAVIGGFRVAINIPGRRPQCFRCKQLGHVRRLCTAVKCASCSRFGHATADCSQSGPSYADIARGSSGGAMQAESESPARMDLEEAFPPLTVDTAPAILQGQTNSSPSASSQVESASALATDTEALAPRTPALDFSNGKSWADKMEEHEKASEQTSSVTQTAQLSGCVTDKDGASCEGGDDKPTSSSASSSLRMAGARKDQRRFLLRHRSTPYTLAGNKARNTSTTSHSGGARDEPANTATPIDEGEPDSDPEVNENVMEMSSEREEFILPDKEVTVQTTKSFACLSEETI